MRTPLAVWLVILGCVAAQAQEPPTFSAEVELVQIEVRATGEDDIPVGDLRPEDFIIEEDGERQAIELFEYVAGPGAPSARVEVLDPEAGGDRPEDDTTPSQHTWLYVAPEVRNPVEFQQVAGPLRTFLKNLPNTPGVPS